MFQNSVEGAGKVVKMLGPIGRKGGRCQHSSCRASVFPRAPTWRPGLEPSGSCLQIQFGHEGSFAEPA